jgi:hypothetical protein
MRRGNEQKDDWFIWEEGGSETTIRKPVQGEIIVCFRGKCTVVESEKVARVITGDVATRINDTFANQPIQKVMPVCAAMALAWNKPERVFGWEKVEALSDETGNWLSSPATCGSGGQDWLTCTYTTNKGNIEQYILLTQLPQKDATCDIGDYRAVRTCDWLMWGNGPKKTPLENLTKEQSSNLCALLKGEWQQSLWRNPNKTQIETFLWGENKDSLLLIFSTKEAKSRIIARTQWDQKANTVQVLDPQEAREWLQRSFGHPKIRVFAEGKQEEGTLDSTQAAMLMALVRSDAQRVQSFYQNGATWSEARMWRDRHTKNIFVYKHATGDDYTDTAGLVTVNIELQEMTPSKQPAEPAAGTSPQSGACADAEEYRALVASTVPEKPSTATQLTDIQRRLLCSLLGSNKQQIEESGKRLSRASDGSFSWEAIGDRADLRRTVAGKIIMCFNGKCTVMESKTAETPNLKAQGGLEIPPECAAIALAFFEEYKKGDMSLQAVSKLTATAFSDSNGNWLKTPAECKMSVRMGPTCTYALLDGSLKEATIEWSEFKKTRPQPSTPSAPGPPQQMSGDTGWFKDLFGFLDDSHASFDENRQKFTYDPKKGTLSVADKATTWQAGYFTTPSLALLRHETKQRMDDAKKSGTKTKVRIVTGDVAAMHGDPAYNGALFQAASQFNCLEFATTTKVPEDGVAVYYRDRTQGPACAISCAPGTIVRNYFAHNGTDPQRSEPSDTQINTLRELIDALQGDALVDVQNGYTESTAEKLEKLNAKIKGLSGGDREKTLGELRVGVQLNTEVTCTKVNGNWHRVDPNAKIIVTQVYASALSVAYSSAGKQRAAARFKEETGGSYDDLAQPSYDERELYKGILRETNQGLWEPLARLVLEAAYEATLHAAVFAGIKTVVLTALGGGVFGNKNEWISEAIVRAITIFADAGLDVVINEYTKDDLNYIEKALQTDQATQPLLRSTAFGRGPRVRRFAHSARAVSLYTE